MVPHCTRAAWLALCIAVALVGRCLAGELADFNTAVEQASVPYRAALEQLNGGDGNAARADLEKMNTAWSALVGRFGAHPPDAFDGNDLYEPTLADVGKRITAALAMIKARQLDAARGEIGPVRAKLSQMRRASGIVVLPDCILTANNALDALATYKDKPPDWSKSETRFDVAAKATIYQHELQRCDAMASSDLRADPQFRRLIDGALAGLALVPTAINTRDTDLLSRIITELRSFDTQLAIRYG
jgi:hypothetical protein